MFRLLYWPSSGCSQLYKVTIQYVVHFERRDLVYSGWWHGMNVLHNQAQNKQVTLSNINMLQSNKTNKPLDFSSEVRC